MIMKLIIKTIGGGKITTDFETEDSFERIIGNISNSKFFVIKYGTGTVAVYVPSIIHIIKKE